MRIPLALSFLLGLILPAAISAQESRPPNIIIILADDLGWTDVGCQGALLRNATWGQAF